MEEGNVKLKVALKIVNDAYDLAYAGCRPKEYIHVDFEILTCPECGYETMIPDDTSDTDYKCQYCGNEESDDIPIECDVCGVRIPKGDMEYEEGIGYVCPGHGIYQDD